MNGTVESMHSPPGPGAVPAAPASGMMLGSRRMLSMEIPSLRRGRGPGADHRHPRGHRVAHLAAALGPLLGRRSASRGGVEIDGAREDVQASASRRRWCSTPQGRLHGGGRPTEADPGRRTPGDTRPRGLRSGGGGWGNVRRPRSVPAAMPRVTIDVAVLVTPGLDGPPRGGQP
jgi:hypothetical protein